ncbi:hypothetical protein ACFW1F_17245 [Streptomyces bungoensis]|uniref:hypothetical protein n=1 Tax=Streptomyces bungoensis TaxID=285568 RepID=UPI003698B18A
MKIKRSYVLWSALTLVVLLAAGTTAWGAPRTQWDYRQANRTGLPTVTFTGDKTAPDTLKLYMRLFVERVRDGDTDGLEDLSWHNQWFARRGEAAGARRLVRTYKMGAAGPVNVDMTAEDPYDVRGGTIHFRRTGQQQTFTVFKRDGLWLFAITDWNTTPNTPGKQPLKD